MKKKVYFVTITALTIAISMWNLALIRAQEDGAESKPKHTIKDVMKAAHRDGLLKKVADGEASAEEKSQLLDLYLSLIENQPPKGDAESWQEKTNDVVIAAARVVVGRDGAEVEIKRVANCAACHREHKPPAAP